MAAKASAKAFGIAELLEKILLHLPIKDLLLSQKVCKNWQIACTSTKIRKALFLEPGTGEDVADLRRCSKQIRDAALEGFIQRYQRKHACVINPLFLQHFCGSIFWLEGEKISEASKHRCYHQMSLTQPPTGLGMSFSFYPRPGKSMTHHSTSGMTIIETEAIFEGFVRKDGPARLAWYLS
ncbi:hypothetical protein LTS10_010439 [Elasticomyces elasticus]|nr:hypothetical protein LTS10_010439 [Elasticomyces elasticus]